MLPYSCYHLKNQIPTATELYYMIHTIESVKHRVMPSWVKCQNRVQLDTYYHHTMNGKLIKDLVFIKIISLCMIS